METQELASDRILMVIAKYIRELTHESNIETDCNLFDNGLLTSLDVLDLIDFLEENFKISISEENVDMDSFGTIDNMVSLIEKLTGGY